MFTRKSRFVGLCSCASSFIILASTLSVSHADVSISYTHHQNHVPLVSTDTVYYSANLPGPTPYIQGFTVYMKDWGYTEPNSASDTGSLLPDPVAGGSGSAPGTGSSQTNCLSKDWGPGTYIKDGVWIAYEVKGVPSNGGSAIISYSAWYCWHPGT